MADDRRPAADVLAAFLVNGVPFAFPSIIGPATIGTPTAHSAPPFASIVESPDRFVWPEAGGADRGQSLVPLFPGAPALVGSNPALYDLLAIIDALRVGTTRIRRIAAELVAERLSVSAA